MAGTKTELGKSFLDELVAKLPADKQAAVRDVLSSPEAATAYEFAGSRVSPLDEERTRLEQLQTQLQTREQRLTKWHTELDTWRQGKETEYTDREQKIAAREANPALSTAPPPKKDELGSMTKDEIEKTVHAALAQREGGYIQYVADASKFSAFHLQNFKEVLDVAELVKHPKIGELGVAGVYELTHKEKLDKIRADAAEAEREKYRAEGRQQALTQQPVDMPYPLGEGSPLDVLTMDPTKRPTGDPVTATRMYEQLVAGRT